MRRSSRKNSPSPAVPVESPAAPATAAPGRNRGGRPRSAPHPDPTVQARRDRKRAWISERRAAGKAAQAPVPVPPAAAPAFPPGDDHRAWDRLFAAARDARRQRELLGAWLVEVGGRLDMKGREARLPLGLPSVTRRSMTAAAARLRLEVREGLR